MVRKRSGREPYNVSINKNLTAKLKALSAELKIRQNVLVEEALTDLLKKYGVKTES